MKFAFHFMSNITKVNECVLNTRASKQVIYYKSCTAHQYSLIRLCSIISLALSFWMKHLVIGQLQNPAKYSAFHWSTSRSQAFIGQLFGTSKVVHLPKRTVMVLFTISDA